MFVAFSIAFIVFYFISFLCDDFMEQRLEMNKIDVEREKQTGMFDRQKYTLRLAKYAWINFIGILVLIILPIYLGVALKHDIIVFPTMVMIVYYLYLVLKAIWQRKKAPIYETKLAEAEANHARLQIEYHKYKTKRLVENVLYMMYFAYMIVIIVF